ncbi:MAG: hypothetical protein D6776_09310 [Planctomycetota bacterium]|nr:MAG: hypothetical protein D6776_09310 [Planctomycetota bacterium]
MRALLVTSRVTFVPRNYDDLVCGLADAPEVAALLELDNAAVALGAKALGVVALGAPRFGLTLLRNLTGVSGNRRRAAYRRAGKPVRRVATINDPDVLGWIARLGIDLVINARTRVIYRAPVLALPRLGCINVHHGLLPEQRGTMCDLWALAERRPAGFTVHRMTARVDAGPILERVVVSDGRDRDYLAYLRRAARREAQVLRALLHRWARGEPPCERPNEPPAGLRYRRNPRAAEIRWMRARGMRL